MRIAQLANFYAPLSGGLRTFVSQMRRGYTAAGHETMLVVPGTADEDLSTPYGRQVTFVGRRIPRSGGYRVLTARSRVLALLDSWRPDVLEVNDKLSVPFLAPWARSRGVPLVMFSHERLDEVIRLRVSPLLVGWGSPFANRRLHDLADRVVVASDYSAEEFTPFGTAKLRRVRLGVDLDVFHPDRRVTSGPGGPTVVLVSRLSREKSPELAIEAVRELVRSGVGLRLQVVGDGPLRAKLERQAAGLPITFDGHLDGRARLATLIASADVALSPSRVETFGLATLEALACGVPVVVPRDGASAELVGLPGAGRVTDGTAEGLAGGVRELLNLPLERRQRDARSTAERLPWAGTTGAMLACFAEVLSGSPEPDRPPGRGVRLGA